MTAKKKIRNNMGPFFELVKMIDPNIEIKLDIFDAMKGNKKLRDYIISEVKNKEDNNGKTSI